MSSLPDESCELKAGHPPAVKVGGMRITQNKPVHENKPEPKPDPDEEQEEESKPVEEEPKCITSVSGAPIKGDAQDFPTSSVKAFHEKTPMPTNQYRVNNNKSHHIQQPSKK